MVLAIYVHLAVNIYTVCRVANTFLPWIPILCVVSGTNFISRIFNCRCKQESLLTVVQKKR